MPDLSVVIPTRNRCRELLRTLELLRSARLPSHEVIVADNDSGDGTVRSVARRFPRVRLVRLGANLGCAARNLAAAEARAPALLMLDDDCAPAPRSAARALELLDRRRRLAAVGFRVTLPDGRCEAGGTHNVFVGCCALVRREAFLEAGGYPPDFGYYVEEYALCYRFFAMGLGVRVCGDLLARHRRSGFAARRAEVCALLARNNLLLAARFLPPGLALSRSRELVRWYLNLARLALARQAVAAEVRRTRRQLRRAPPPSERLAGPALEAATSRLALRRALVGLRRQGVRQVGFWRYTKDALTFLRSARAAGIRVRQVASDMLEAGTLGGVPVVPPTPAAARPGLVWLVPTFSPGLARNALGELAARGLEGRPFFRYDSAGR